MAGTLYLVATPIGNLEDMTFRAIRTLKEVDLIAAEDTRNSIKLLNHFEIQTPMTSYHEYNKFDKGRKLVEKLEEGLDIAVITDAGTPGISDPGEELVKMCYETGIRVTSVPGPAACVTALTMSGLPTRRFAFEAFLPTDKKEREEVLKEMAAETRTIVMYEAPHRLVKTLKLLSERLGDRKVTVCRELTKRHETAFQSTLEGAVAYYEANDPKGECNCREKPGRNPSGRKSALGRYEHRRSYGALYFSGARSQRSNEKGRERPRRSEARNL